MIIYKATNILNQKIYVGQTIHTLEKRKSQHERAHRYSHSKNFIFSRAIKKYGKENFTWEIIDSATSIDELNKKEIFWIEKLNSLAENGLGYNEKYGGNNHKHSHITKSKIKNSQKGSKSHRFGKVGSENAQSKKVINITDNVIYESANLCAKEESLNNSHICAVCRGDRATTGGKVFRYIDSNGEIIEPKTYRKTNITKIVNHTTGEVFDDCKKAVKSVGKKVASNLSNKLLNGNGVCFYSGFIWSYCNTSRELIENFKIPVVEKPQKRQMKKVLNLTTGVVFESISQASKSKGATNYTYLSRLLNKGNGKCIWRGCEWKFVK